MKDEKIYRSLEYVRDEYLESAADAMRFRPKRKRFRRPWGRIAVAACLVLAAVIVAVPIWFLDTTDPLDAVDEITLSATDLAELFNLQLMDGTGTKRYTKVSINNPDSFALTDEEYLPIYEYDPTKAPLDESEFEEFAIDRLKRLASAVNVTLDIDESMKDNSFHIKSDSGTQHRVYALQQEWENRIGFHSLASSQLDGQSLRINADLDDDELIASIDGLQNKLFELYDVSFDDVKIVRQSSEIIIVFYNYNDHPMNGIASLAYSDNITYWYGFDGKILSEYTQNRPSATDLYGVIGKAKTLPLEKAEEYLAKGYVFGGYHACPICRREEEKAQPLVDFTDYDYVNLEYVDDISKSKSEKHYTIPFYAFYKYVGDNDNGERLYAKTYVPAIEVEGIVEYFSHRI